MRVSKQLLFLLLVVVAFPFSRAAANTPDVVIVTIDTLRADRVGCYGYAKAHTPTLDRLSTEGTMFTHAVSHVPLTRPSHLSIFTGLFPFQYNVHDNVSAPLDPKIPTLAEHFHNHGYATAAVVANGT
jgi:arylsulfatase A-like enzyme